MATVTPNFNWPVPTSTDLVKDGATAIEALGDSIDASLVDLKGGTTGQVLSKTSGTDMDFTWVTTDDANAIQNSIVDAKGDLISATANDTPARLAVGANGETLVADSSTSTGLRYQGNFAAGKNAIINGDFNIWQRGTSFSPPGAGSYTSDRWRTSYGTAVPTTYVVSQQTFTPGSEPVSGYNSPYFWRGVLTTVGTTTEISVQQRIENVYTFANTTVTFSFYAKSDSNRTQTVNFQQNFGSGGSSTVGLTAQTINTTSSWQRFSLQFSIPSTVGKTIGANSYLQATISQNLTNGNTLDIWGVQVEAGSVATAFQTATGTIQGELAACQRYYLRVSVSDGKGFGQAHAYSASNALGFIPFPVTMRTPPTALEQNGSAGTYAILSAGGSAFACTSVPTFNSATEYMARVIGTTTNTTLTAGNSSQFMSLPGQSAYLGWSAEL